MCDYKRHVFPKCTHIIQHINKVPTEQNNLCMIGDVQTKPKIANHYKKLFLCRWVTHQMHQLLTSIIIYNYITFNGKYSVNLSLSLLHISLKVFEWQGMELPSYVHVQYLYIHKFQQYLNYELQQLLHVVQNNHETLQGVTTVICWWVFTKHSTVKTWLVTMTEKKNFKLYFTLVGGFQFRASIPSKKFTSCQPLTWAATCWTAITSIQDSS